MRYPRAAGLKLARPPAAGWSQHNKKKLNKKKGGKTEEEALVPYDEQLLYPSWALALILIGLFRAPLAELGAQLVGSRGSPGPDPGAGACAATLALLRLAALAACCGEWWEQIAKDFVRRWPEYDRFLCSEYSPLRLLLSAWDPNGDPPAGVSR